MDSIVSALCISQHNIEMLNNWTHFPQGISKDCQDQNEKPARPPATTDRT